MPYEILTVYSGRQSSSIKDWRFLWRIPRTSDSHGIMPFSDVSTRAIAFLQAYGLSVRRASRTTAQISSPVSLLPHDSYLVSRDSTHSLVFMTNNQCTVRNFVVEEDLPRCFDLLLYGMNVCAQRWYFARTFIVSLFSATKAHSQLTTPAQIGRLEKVLRSAVVGKTRPLSESALPSQFYDLRYSSVDIDEALRLWSMEH